MKILVFGLEGTDPELLFGDERLLNLRRLMEFGCYGLLEGALPPAPALAWTCIAKSQKPDSLAERGQPGQADRPRDGTQTGDSGSTRDRAIWDQIILEEGPAILVDVPPSFPPRKIKGISVSFAIPSGSSTDVGTYPAAVYEEIVGLVGEYPLAGGDAGCSESGSLVQEVQDLSRSRFAVVRHLLRSHPWSYLHYVDSGLARLQSGSCQGHDPQPAIRDYYRFVDGELGTILEALDEDAIVLVICLDSAEADGQARHGAFVLAASSNPLQGELAGVHAADLGPTVLDLAGYGVPAFMQGRSLVEGYALEAAAGAGLAEDDEEILRERLSGLGYL